MQVLSEWAQQQTKHVFSILCVCGVRVCMYVVCTATLFLRQIVVGSYIEVRILSSQDEWCSPIINERCLPGSLEVNE